MNAFLAALVGLNIFIGWLPTDTNSVDSLSLLNFIVASLCAFALGLPR